MENKIMVQPFSVDGVSGVTFGGFAVDRFMCSRPDKRPYRSKTLPEAMIIAADKGKGSHLLTSFEWASLAYLWKNAKSLDDCPVDLHAETWQWVMGLFMKKDGHVDVLASLDVTAEKSPYGRGTIRGYGGSTPEVVCDGIGENWLKQWAPGEFDGRQIYIAEADNGAGKFYTIVNTLENAVQLPSGIDLKDGTATFCIVRHVSIDVTAGMDSGDKITSLRDSDPDLKAFAIPAASNDEGNVSLGYDRFWFYKMSEVRAALRGGAFADEALAGVFSLDLVTAPSYSYCVIGFRAGKAL